MLVSSSEQNITFDYYRILFTLTSKIMHQQQNKPVLTMRMLLFLCTSMMMMSPVVEGVLHVGRVAATLSEATTTTKTMIRRRSVQEEVLNYNNAINNNDAVDGEVKTLSTILKTMRVTITHDASDYESTTLRPLLILLLLMLNRY